MCVIGVLDLVPIGNCKYKKKKKNDLLDKGRYEEGDETDKRKKL